MKNILVTGATGNIGEYVVQFLNEGGAGVRLAMRRPSESNSDSIHDSVRLDFNDPTTFGSAVQGCESLFLLRPPAVSNTKKTLNKFIDAAYERGVEHIVFVSVSGAENNTIVPHHAVEQHLIQSDRSYTILRPGFFAQNIGGAYRQDIVSDDRIILPSGEGLVNFIDTRDIAEVASLCLLDPGTHSKRACTLVGQEAVSFDQVADMLSKQLERKISYEATSVFKYWRHLKKQKLGTMQAVVQAVLHYGIRSGQAHIMDKTTEKILKRPPTSISDYIRDHKQLWEKPTRPED